ncbi:M15 family metallopeptidase [Paenibacillus sp. FSL H8-0259]|uniref:M15 family metallopeptidase n=1 Tax=Paenibacillus sp. FSL H8-0259 TaxID=1920423 RepID=UPI00096E51ED|nr:M15 family metallopeptidase [Paenibacillus sp. FSL H8-0259]OMF21899.1 peptidase M15 [Paenibacillus sp. FSL H8-0259]
MTYTIAQVRAKSAAKLSGLLSADKAAAEALIDFAYACGVPIVITQGLRTIAEQDGLYAQGRTKPGQIVTNARGGYSYHNFSVAIDFALLLPNGGVSWDTKRDGDGDGIADWDEVVAQAKRIGWDWGGDWRTFTDLPHFEMTFGLSTADYRAGKRPTQAQLDAVIARVKGLYEEADEMTATEKAEFKALQETVAKQAETIATLEGKTKMTAIPSWATQACVNAKAAGFIDTTADGSYDFYRMITLLDRAGLFVKKGGAI